MRVGLPMRSRSPPLGWGGGGEALPPRLVSPGTKAGRLAAVSVLSAMALALRRAVSR